MVQDLSTPEVIRCYFDNRFDPHLPVMCLRWEETSLEQREQSWDLPEGVMLAGLPPEHFGISIQRRDSNSYGMRLLWDRTYLCWMDLSREQLMRSSLPAVLAAMGTDLWYLLEQPIRTTMELPDKAA